MIERSQVRWGTTTIAYEVRRSARRATVSLAIEPGAGLRVTAPAATPISKLDAVVRSRALWIASRLREPEPIPPEMPPRELVSGETFLYLGKQHRLCVSRGGDVGPLQLRGGQLCVTVPRVVPSEHASVYARAALIDWYRRRARAFIPTRLAIFAAKLDVSPAKVVIADQSKRWGSCSAGVVRINWRIMQAPKRLIEYVLAHEAVHLIHEDHGRRFWATLGRLMPDYEARKVKLRELGGRFVW